MTDEEIKTLVANLAVSIEKITKEIKEMAKETAKERKKTEAAQRKTEAVLASLAEEHKKTKASQRKTEAAQRKTEAILASLAEKHKKTEASQRKTEKAAQRKTKKASQRKTEAAQRKTEKALALFTEETRISRQELRKEIGGISHTQGEIAEDLFGRNLKSLMQKRGIVLQEVDQRLKNFGSHEYDLVGLNSKNIVIVEIKSKLKQEDVTYFIKEKIALFRQEFPKYKKRGIIGALGALVVKKEVENYARKQGLYVLTQKGEEGAAIMNPPGFQAKIY